MNNFQWSLRVASGSRGQAVVYVRQHQFTIGAPVQFDEQYDGLTALEYVLGAVGEAGHPGLETVRVRVYVSSVEPEDRIRRVWDEMLEKSPLVCTFRASIALEIELKVVI